MSAEVSKQLNVPVANILISATRDHSAIFGGPRPPAAAAIPENTPAELFEEKLTSGAGCQEAHDKMQPARIGYGAGNL